KATRTSVLRSNSRMIRQSRASICRTTGYRKQHGSLSPSGGEGRGEGATSTTYSPPNSLREFPLTLTLSPKGERELHSLRQTSPIPRPLVLPCRRLAHPLFRPGIINLRDPLHGKTFIRHQPLQLIAREMLLIRAVAFHHTVVMFQRGLVLLPRLILQLHHLLGLERGHHDQRKPAALGHARDAAPLRCPPRGGMRSDDVHANGQIRPPPDHTRGPLNPHRAPR